MNYLDTDKQIKLYKKALNNKIYVDKTLLIQKVSEQMENGNGCRTYAEIMKIIFWIS